MKLKFILIAVFAIASRVGPLDRAPLAVTHRRLRRGAAEIPSDAAKTPT